MPPQLAEFDPSGVSPAASRLGVNGPPIGMMVCALLGLLYCGGFVAWAFSEGNAMGRRKIARRHVVFLYTLVVVVPGLTALVYAAVVYGSVQMIRHKSYAWATAASILRRLLPCKLPRFSQCRLWNLGASRSSQPAGESRVPIVMRAGHFPRVRTLISRLQARR